MFYCDSCSDSTLLIIQFFSYFSHKLLFDTADQPLQTEVNNLFYALFIFTLETVAGM
jgi:hypothetical protein